ncbi:electron transport complex subunit RsxC [Thalassotalea sp. 1_MG-2023]|uniref:electron transport complex subunit RsxC n=1 Tax=Thalassotalea sp. 1_MG-2023 TaxID=3062680 RepID=UPI0026E45623|nr:electron transport complex subunit RsxC [Thalassotalea sp. 1_MG-2023]MDO6426718.1 electron transport complex subunit RsxC [Thalassotalea sp. 1_MG-2023]
MESVIERIERGQFWPFHGGINPPEMKFLTNEKPIRSLPLPEKLVIPVQQHIGEPGDLLVAVGDTVLKGQALTKASAPLMVPVHAPTSGKITNINLHVIAHPSGLSELCVTLVPDGEDRWRKRHITENFHELSKDTLIEKIADAGISGMGGAGFPTHVKVNTQAQINYLIINAAECEPYITADDLLVRENAGTILDGINILDKVLEPAFILIGIEDNKPLAIEALRRQTQDIDKIKVCVLPTKYPMGGEKQLIQALTGQEVASGVLPSALGIVMQNIATCFAIAEAVISDTPLIKRVITVSGQALSKPQNVWALLGTPVSFLLKQCGYPEQTKKHIIMGGPMMGFSLASDEIPVVKTTNCLLAPSEKEIPDDNIEVECIRCGQCADACPAQLLPQELQWSAKAQDYEQLNKLNLFDCIECGACAYVCPSHIPLVHYYRVAKAEIREQKLLDIKAEKAKQRFEARKARLERDKRIREEKHKKAAEARKARMNSGTKEANKEKSAVAAALARVQAKKQQKAPDDDNQPNDNDKSPVAAAIARAKAKKAAKQNTTSKQKPIADDDKSTRVAAAVAKAKAKKAQASAHTKDDTPDSYTDNTQKADSVDTTEQSPKSTQAENDKKARVAAAVAKAKAKKAQASTPTQDDEPDSNSKDNTQETASVDTTEQSSTSSQAENDKKARIAAAVAKAKAKKAQASAPTQDDEPDSNSKDNTQKSESVDTAEQSSTSSQAENDKKARIAAAVAKAKAKAKAKKAQASAPTQDDEPDSTSKDNTQETESVDTTEQTSVSVETDNDKKARIAAAVAKAKAKKQQKNSKAN